MLYVSGKDFQDVEDAEFLIVKCAVHCQPISLLSRHTSDIAIWVGIEPILDKIVISFWRKTQNLPDL